MVAATENDKNGSGKLLERNNVNYNATSASTEKRAMYKTDDELNASGARASRRWSLSRRRPAPCIAGIKNLYFFMFFAKAQ